MTQEQMTQFARIFNTLSTISTKGEDTLIMSDCLRAMQTLYQELLAAQGAVNLAEPAVEGE